LSVEALQLDSPGPFEIGLHVSAKGSGPTARVVAEESLDDFDGYSIHPLATSLRHRLGWLLLCIKRAASRLAVVGG
jgi:hypothetical protein